MKCKQDKKIAIKCLSSQTKFLLAEKIIKKLNELLKDKDRINYSRNLLEIIKILRKQDCSFVNESLLSLILSNISYFKNGTTFLPKIFVRILYYFMIGFFFIS